MVAVRQAERRIGRPLTSRELGAYFDVPASTVKEWRYRGADIDERRADHLAAALSLHPLELWPEWADIPAMLADREQPCARCDQDFERPARGAVSRHCSPCNAALRRQRVNARYHAKKAAA